MSNDTINAEVAEATGEDIETIRDLGFYLIIQVVEGGQVLGTTTGSAQTRSAANDDKRSRMRGIRR